MRWRSLAVLIVVPAIACDALEFVEIAGPPPRPPRASVTINSDHHDALDVRLSVGINWPPAGESHDVRVDDRPVPEVSRTSQGSHFLDEWAVPADRLGELPEVLRFPAPDGDPIVLTLPVLFRASTGPLLCFGAADLVFEFQRVGDPEGETLHQAWTFRLSSPEGQVHLQGPGPLVSPLHIPRELLGSGTEEWHASLLINMASTATDDAASVQFSAHLAAHWLLRPEGAEGC